MNFLEIKEIFKKFDGTQALNGVSFNVPQGSIFGLLGPNGAGKTTLIRIINRIFLPDKGEILFNGKPLSSENIPQIGYLPEERGLYKKMKVGEQLIFFARLKGLLTHEASQKAKEWLKRLEIESWWDKPIEQLSKGMAQKVQFVSTVLHNPSLLIFDEPFSGFDPINVDIIQDQIRYLREQGTTIIFSAHNMASVEEICDEIVLINKGNIILEGNIKELKKRFSHNQYFVSFSNPLDDTIVENYKLEIVENSFPNTYSLELENNEKINNFLSYVSKYAQIEHFQKNMPSLHDIFVSQVKLFNQKIGQNEQN